MVELTKAVAQDEVFPPREKTRFRMFVFDRKCV